MIDPRDLKIIRPYAMFDYEGKVAINVRHRGCLGVVGFEPDEQDPIMSKYYCHGSTYQYCDWKWTLADIANWRREDLDHHFYTELTEDPDELLRWPEKIGDVRTKHVCYTALRPVTQEELLRCRVNRLFDIRDQA